MAITTMDGLVNAIGNASQDQKLFFPSATNVAGGWINLNQAVTSSFGIMATPTAAGSGGKTYNRTSETTGFPRFNNPAGGLTQYIGRLGATFATAGTLHIYDLLWACSGLVGNVATAQNVTSFSGMPTRNTTGTGCEIWVGCSSAIGATAHNVTVSYTNQAGTAGRTTVSTAGIASMPANRMYQLPLQSGDTGVQSIQSMTLSASSGTAGNLWLLILQRQAGISAAVPNVATTLDFAGLGMPIVADNETFVFVHQGTTTSSGIIMGLMNVIEG
jgi:hypothetical protein